MESETETETSKGHDCCKRVFARSRFGRALRGLGETAEMPIRILASLLELLSFWPLPRGPPPTSESCLPLASAAAAGWTPNLPTNITPTNIA